MRFLSPFNSDQSVMKYILIFSFAALLLFGCKKEEENTAPVAVSNISGHVKFISASTAPITSFPAVKVTLASPAGSWQAHTDAAGYYEVPNLPTGQYDITYESSGFGTLKAFSFAHIGSQNQYIGARSLYQLSGDEVLSFPTEPTYNAPWIQINAQTKLTGENYFNLLLGQKPGFKPSEATSVLYCRSTNSQIQGSLYLSSSAMYSSGDTIYGCFYPAAVGAALASYTTPQGEIVYPGFGKRSPEFFIVVP